MELQKKIFCSVLNDWCDRQSNELGKCGGRKTTPLNTMALAIPCEHVVNFVDSRFKESAQGGATALIGSLDEDTYHGRLIEGTEVDIITVSSGSIFQDHRPLTKDDKKS